MKVITEAMLREQLHHEQPKSYYVEAGVLLSPAAREYLQQRKIAIREKDCRPPENKKEAISSYSSKNLVGDEKNLFREENQKKTFRYVDYKTGAFYEVKPESMTQLRGNYLVDKCHPRIAFRSEMDRLQAEILLFQTMLSSQCSEALLRDLDEILILIRTMIRSEVLEESLPPMNLLGLTSEELRDHSHHPEKYYGVKQMTLPDRSMGPVYAWLNLVRTSVRRAEVVGNQALGTGRDQVHKDILESLNRLSSALHIMMCKYLAGGYE